MPPRSSLSRSSGPVIAVGQSSSTAAHDRMVFILLALVGSRVVATLKGGIQYSGILSAATADGQINIALRQAQQVSNDKNAAASSNRDPSSQSTSSTTVKPNLLIQAKDLLELEAIDISLEGRPQERDGFKTDTQVTGNAFDRREKQLQAWGAGPSSNSLGSLGAAGGGIEDDLQGLSLETAGPAAAGRGQWDQFAANEKLYGLKSDYDDELYTTKLDRSGADYRQREAKAAQLEREILKGGGGALAHNPHMAEERGMTLDDSGLNEEERYSGVIRGEGAYVPPGARKNANAASNGVRQSATSTQPSSTAPSSTVPAVQSATGNVATAAQAASAQAQDPSIVSVSRLPATVSGTSRIPPAGGATASVDGNKTAAATAAASGQKPAAPSLDSSLRNFVSLERQRLSQKKEALVKAAERQDKDSKLASLLQFSQSYNLKWPVPDDIAEIAGHDPKKLAASRASASKPVTPVVSPSREARSLAPASASTSQPGSVSASTSPSLSSAMTRPRLTASQIAEIPPFNPARAKARQQESASSSATATATSTSPAATTGSTTSTAAAGSSVAAATSTPATKPLNALSTSKINPNAPAFVFKPNPNASSFTPGATHKPVETAPAVPVNPFFGTKQIKRGSSSMHVKEDFTPFKTGIVHEPAAIVPTWSFTGKPYRAMYGPAPTPAPQIHAHQTGSDVGESMQAVQMPPPPPPPPPAQLQAYGGVYVPPPPPQFQHQMGQPPISLNPNFAAPPPPPPNGPLGPGSNGGAGVARYPGQGGPPPPPSMSPFPQQQHQQQRGMTMMGFGQMPMFATAHMTPGPGPGPGGPGQPQGGFMRYAPQQQQQQPHHQQQQQQQQPQFAPSLGPGPGVPMQQPSQASAPASSNGTPGQ